MSSELSNIHPDFLTIVALYSLSLSLFPLIWILTRSHFLSLSRTKQKLDVITRRRLCNSRLVTVDRRLFPRVALRRGHFPRLVFEAFFYQVPHEWNVTTIFSDEENFPRDNEKHRVKLGYNCSGNLTLIFNSGFASFYLFY